MNPLLLSSLFTGIGAVGSLFQDDPNEQLREFQRQRQERLRNNLQEFETLRRTSIESNARANSAGAKAATRSALRRRGLEDTEIGARRINEASRSANSAFNQQLADLDLNIFNQRQRIEESEQPIIDQPSTGFGRLFSAGLGGLLQSLGNSSPNKGLFNLDQNNALAQNSGLRAV